MNHFDAMTNKLVRTKRMLRASNRSLYRAFLLFLFLPLLAVSSGAQSNPIGVSDPVWGFKPFRQTADRKYFETHVKDDEGTHGTGTIKLELECLRSGNGTLEIEVLLESTAVEDTNYTLPATSIPFTASDTEITIEIPLLARPNWFRERWLWVDIIEHGMPGRDRVLIGIRPSDSVSPPSVSFAAVASNLPAGGVVDVEVQLSQPSDDDVEIRYTTSGTLGGITVPESGLVTIPAGDPDAPLRLEADLTAVPFTSFTVSLDYENADGSDINQFFGTHSWTHTNTEALGVDGFPSFSGPGDEQGFFVGGPCDSGFETDTYVQQETVAPLEHFDGSGPVLGVVVHPDTRRSPYVRADSELSLEGTASEVGVNGPNALVRMDNFQEIVVYIGEFVGDDEFVSPGISRNANKFRLTLRARTADISHVLVIYRDPQNGEGDDDLQFNVGGTAWSVERGSNIDSSNVQPTLDEILITGIDYGDGQGLRTVLIYRHEVDPTRLYTTLCDCTTDPCMSVFPINCPSLPCGYECSESRANIILFPSRFEGAGNCNNGVPSQEIGRGALFYGVSYTTSPTPFPNPIGNPVPRFWERRGLWPEPRGGARMDHGEQLIHHVRVVP